MKTQIAILIGALALTGCTSIRDQVPASMLTGTIMGQPYSLAFPKDMSADEISITVATNGNVSVKILNIVAKTNPDVVTMTGNALTQIINARGQAVATGVAAVGDATGKAGAAFIKNTVAPTP